MSQTNRTHLEKIKEAVHKSDKLSEEEKSMSVKIIEEWLIEDKAFGLLAEKLFNVSTEMKSIFAELGII